MREVGVWESTPPRVNLKFFFPFFFLGGGAPRRYRGLKGRADRSPRARRNRLGRSDRRRVAGGRRRRSDNASVGWRLHPDRAPPPVDMARPDRRHFAVEPARVAP